MYSVFVGLVTQLCSPPNVCAWRSTSIDTHCVHMHTKLSLSVFTMLGTLAVLSSLHSGVVVLL